MKTGVPVLVMAAIFAAIVASIVIIGDVVELREQRADRDLFLEATSDGWAEASEEFFRSPAAAAELVQAGVDQPDLSISMSFLLAAVQLDSDIDAAFVGYPNGDFLFAGRSDGGGYRTRQITGSEDEQRTDLAWYDDDLNLLDEAIDADDPYDPRDRPWFDPIASGTDAAWSDPYVFASSGHPGITYSTGARDDDGSLLGVVGVDVRLTALDRFLGKLRPGPTGAAALLAADGELIALSEGADSFDSTELVVPAEPGVLKIDSLPGERRYSARRFGPDGAWTLAAVANDADFISAEDRPAVFALKWLAVALPIAVLMTLVLRPVAEWCRSIYSRATRDAITGLANRSAITTALRRPLEHEDEPVTVAIVDLDDFKPVNDTWGHRIGDEALRTVGERLNRFSEDHHMTAGRLGGDEFLVIATGDSAIAADEAWTNLVDTMAVPFDVRGHEIRIGASVGVVHIRDDDDRSVEHALSLADRALYGVKRRGGNGWQSNRQPIIDTRSSTTTADPSTITR